MYMSTLISAYAFLHDTELTRACTPFTACTMLVARAHEFHTCVNCTVHCTVPGRRPNQAESMGQAFSNDAFLVIQECACCAALHAKV